MHKQSSEGRRKLEALKVCLNELKRERVEAAHKYTADPTPENRAELTLIHAAIEAVHAASADAWKKYPAKASFGWQRTA